MPRVYSALALLVTLMFLGSSSASAEVILLATLTNAAENPPATPTTTSTGAPRPASFGTAMFTLNDAMTSLSFTATVTNIDVTGSQTPDTNDDLQAAHIHAPAPPTSNAGVVWGFFGMPFNDNNPTDTELTPFATGVGGMFTSKWDAPEGNNTTLTAQLTNILNNQSYINFHTTQFAGGEIRGQLLVQDGQVEPIPEPSTMFMVGLGSAALIRAARRRRKAPVV